VTLLALFAVFASACSAESDETPTDDVSAGSDCEGHGEPVVLGMEKQTGGGLYAVSLDEATPLPPRVGENSWTVDVATSEGEPVSGAAVILDIEMVGHQHRLRKDAVMTTAGVYEFPPVPVTMTGYWEFTVSVVPEGSDEAADPENAVFGFCVPPD
jgi:hypothetical protein